MNTKIYEKPNKKEIFHLISTIISWTLFSILIICAAFLLYYFIATQIYAVKGEKYEPKFSLYSIMSNSMKPNINVYDVIVDVRVDNPEEKKAGDVITFISHAPETDGMTITHRVVAVIKNKDGQYSYQTKGDNAPAEDTGRVAYSSIIGKVALKIPMLGRLQLLVSDFTGGILILLCVSLFIILKGLVKRLFNKIGPINFQNKLLTLLNKPLYLPYKSKVLTDSGNIEIKENKNEKPISSLNKNTLEDINYDDIDIDLPDLKEEK